MKFKIEDKVKIKETSSYFNQHAGIGKITEVNNKFVLPYLVAWNDGYHNTYGDIDLELIYETQSQKLFRK